MVAANLVKVEEAASPRGQCRERRRPRIASPTKTIQGSTALLGVQGGDAADSPTAATPPPRGDGEPMLVTVPQGMGPGKQLQVPAPDGQMLTVTVPLGSFAGSMITVEEAMGQEGEEEEGVPPASTPQSTKMSSIL